MGLSWQISYMWVKAKLDLPHLLHFKPVVKFQSRNVFSEQSFKPKSPVTFLQSPSQSSELFSWVSSRTRGDESTSSEWKPRVNISHVLRVCQAWVLKTECPTHKVRARGKRVYNTNGISSVFFLNFILFWRFSTCSAVFLTLTFHLRPENEEQGLTHWLEIASFTSTWVHCSLKQPKSSVILECV